MAVKLRTVYYATKDKYELTLVAGEKGLDNLFSWIHILENITTTNFIYGNEIILTTGIGINEENWLYEYVKKIIAKGAAGLIVNVGDFITEIPQNVIFLCAEHNFPLMTVPWKVHLIDIIRDYCNRIFLTEQLSFSLMGSIKNAIFQPADTDLYEKQLERNNFLLQAPNAMLAFSSNTLNFQEMEPRVYDQFRMSIESLLNQYNLNYCLFEYNDDMLLVLNDITLSKLKAFTSKLQLLLSKKYAKDDIRVGVSALSKNIYTLHAAFKQAIFALSMTAKEKLPIYFFESTSINSILLSIEDNEFLASLLQETLDPLIAYDQNHGTNLVETLYLYLTYNSSVKKVSEITFTHRNTINYRMKKIKQLLNTTLESNDDKVKYTMAYYICDPLSDS